MEMLILAVIALAIIIIKDRQIIKLEEERDRLKKLYFDTLKIMSKTLAEGDKDNGQEGKD